MPTVLLAYYCALILVASILGGMIPVWFQLTHRWMQFAVSFVAGVMLGIGVLHMLPHALLDATLAVQASTEATATAGDTNPRLSPEPKRGYLARPSRPEVARSTDLMGLLPSLAPVAQAVRAVTISLLAGMLVMFFIERFFSFHHHDVPDDAEHDHGHDHEHHDHSHAHAHESQGADLSWGGAALGLFLHSLLNGVALAAAVQCESGASRLAGFSTFLVIVLHKPFDAMMISALMGRSRWSLAWRHTINGLFSLAIPVGVLVFYFGLMSDQFSASAASQQWWIACALAFSAGTFLCISLSDLLPELQFHRHDRVKLSAALLLGLAVAHLAAQLEATAHRPHTLPAPPAKAAS